MNPDVTAILNALREGPLAWIADEIESEIQRGKLEMKMVYEGTGRRGKQATTVEPYSNEQQEEILLRSLAHYFVTLPRMWERGTKDLGIELGESIGTHVNVRMEDGPFSPQWDDLSEKLHRYLARAWPHGLDDFAERFIEMRTEEQ